MNVEQERARRTLELWFFRDLSEDQRKKLLGLFQLPVHEVRTRAHERLCLDYVLKLLMLKPADIAPSDFTADALSWGNALNEAGWKFIEVCPEKSALLFNNAKGALREAIIVYADCVFTDRQRSSVNAGKDGAK